MEIIPLTEATGRTDTLLYKTLHLRKLKDLPPDTPGSSPGISPEKYLCAQFLGTLHRYIVVPQREKGKPLASVENIFSYMYNKSSVFCPIN